MSGPSGNGNGSGNGGNGNGGGKHLYTGIPTITDGSGAVVWVETNITQAACAYPITSSTVMGGGYSGAVANGQLNLWGEKLVFIEPEIAIEFLDRRDGRLADAHGSDFLGFDKNDPA